PSVTPVAYALQGAPLPVLRGGSRLLKPDEIGEEGLFPTYREEFEVAWADSRPVS
ncbi:DUF5919 domain-containing protein, partial [Streptomyces sp. NPDC058398]|uniref:DUF5919 domain-containing protein n=1 Tax=Streptomyces sp. NPDC058398 TaxID=3346479 RepID=UPI00365FF2D9